MNIIQSGRRKIIALPLEELMAQRAICYSLQWHLGAGDCRLGRGSGAAAEVL